MNKYLDNLGAFFVVVIWLLLITSPCLMAVIVGIVLGIAAK